MKKEVSSGLFNRCLKFSIRKLSVGIASLAIGAFWVGSSATPTFADTVTTGDLTHSPLVQYHYVTQDELTAEEEQLIQNGLPQNHDAHCHNYYLVYRPTSQGILPKTASESLSLLTMAGEVLFVVLGLSVIVTSKGKKERIVSSIMLITLSGTIFMPSIQALQTQKLSAYNQVYQVSTGDKLPEITEIPGYQYVGYISLCGCQAKDSQTSTQLLPELPVEPSSDMSRASSVSTVDTLPSSATQTEATGESVVEESVSETEVLPADSTTPSSSEITPVVKPTVPESSKSETVESEVISVPSSTQAIVKEEVVTTIPTSTEVIIKEDVVTTIPTESTLIETSETTISTENEAGEVETSVTEVETVVTVPTSTEVVTEVETVVTVPTSTEAVTEVEPVEEELSSSSELPVPSSSSEEPSLSSELPTSSSPLENSSSSSELPTSSSPLENSSSSSELPTSSSSSEESSSSSELPTSSSPLEEESSSSSELPVSSSSSEEPSSSSEVTEEPVVNKEELRQLVEEDESLKETVRYAYATLEVKQSYDELLVKAQQLLLDNQATQEQVDAGLLSLKEAIERLNGRLYREPELVLIGVEKDDDGRTATLNFSLSDEDGSYRSALVKVYREDQLVKEVSVSDISQPLTVDGLAYEVPYRFETELTYDLRDGDQTKTISHDQTVTLVLKQEPELVLTGVEKDSLTKSLSLSYQLTDPDQAYVSAVAKIYDGDTLVKELALTDLSQPVRVEGLDYNIPYTIKTDLVYDRRDGEQTKTTTYEETVELTLKQVVFKDLTQVTLYKYENNQLVKQETASPTDDLSAYVVKLESDKYKDVYLPVSSITNDGKVRVVWPELVQENSADNSYQKDLELTLGQQNATTDYSQLDDYDSARQVAYQNIEKLLPFYNKETILDYGNKVSESSKLYTTPLVNVVPMVDNAFVTDYYGQHDQINRLMLHYSDDTVEYVDLTAGQFFKDSQVKEYSLAGTDLIYTPEQLIQNQDSFLDDLVTELQGMDYFDSLSSLYPNFAYDTTLVVAERLRLGLANNKAGNAQAEASLRASQVDPIYLESTYNKVKDNIRSYLKSLLSQEAVYASTDQAGLTYLKEQILANKEKLMLGLTYMDRLYNINYDDKNIKELSLFRQDFFGNEVSPYEFLTNIGNLGTDKLMFKNSATTYATAIGSQNGQATVMDYLSAYNRLLTDKTDNDWFKSASKAYIVETPSLEVADSNSDIYYALSKERHQMMILPLLTLSEEGLFIISNMTSINMGMFDRDIDMTLKETDPATYEQKVAAYKKQVDLAAKWQRDYYDAWYRIALDSVKDQMYNRSDMPIPNWDGYQFNSNGTWMQPYGETASSRMTDFFAPIGKWYAPNGTAAYANGGSSHFVIYSMITQEGQSTFTHEMTHNLDGTVYLGGYGRRQGMGAEAYSRGWGESPEEATTKIISVNLFADYINDFNGAYATRRNHSASPERFQNSGDLEEYMRGMFDVLHTLDAIEGEIYVDSSLETKKQFFRRFEAVPDAKGGDATGRNRAFTEDEWNRLSFNSISDLVNNEVVAALTENYGRGVNKDLNINRSNYTSSPMFVSIYSSLTNPTGSSNSLTFKRLSFELLAEAGYENGMLNYASNKLKDKAASEGKTFSDTYVLKEIFGDKYETFADFKIDMLESHLAKAKAGEMKVLDFTYKRKTYQTTYEQIKTLMTEAINNNKPADVISLKEAVYRAYLLNTDDFRQSVYQ
ncbi:ZmpA/ZmpB/ZmpC family metallo-endopeptidase [Streptococcus sp. sy004]|uniref:ZmpA/ZmpB/ZmpC family metallo-endopeptidase n=1 Tax=Streptococcus sp. sy004 TaxID=2600149 RepID=UPI0011B62CD5|nr:ZmpA/ZmpB/ZmpC family metallo-endopeptidase [Streptococcus sp. sy004]TWT10403.1 YSIRK-type signal peptide-containing protein [Streptococcus sp. sy004]